jgi:acyl-CoA thioesterase FadM
MTAFEADDMPSRQRMTAQRSDFRFWTEEKLRNADTDQFRHVNNAVIATFFEAARMEIFAPPSVRTLMGGANLAVVRLLIEFCAEVHFPGRVRVGSAVIGVGNTSLRGWTTTVARGRKPCASWFTARPDVPIQSHLNCAHTCWPTTRGRLSHERKQGHV